MNSTSIAEANRATPVRGDFDVIVAGSGPAGVSAALAAAETGARTLLLEVHGCLGGVWTSGLLGIIIDAENKPGIIRHLISILHSRGASNRIPIRERFSYDPEQMKLLLEQRVIHAGICVRLHTRVVAAVVRDGMVTHVMTESKSGREAWAARYFVDATGDGDLGALAGCNFDIGDGEGHVQPMSLLTTVAGVQLDQIEECVRWGDDDYRSKRRLRAELDRAGVEPSIGKPALFPLYDDLFVLMGDHQHERAGIDADDVTMATIAARRELHSIVRGLRSLGGRWKGIRVATTPEQIGVREARRLRGRYNITVQDVTAGIRHEDSVCHVRAPVDVHPVSAASDKLEADWSQGHSVVGYDIPYRALQSESIANLLFAGRCISGDFFAHSSYRVTGDAAVTGEAAGCAASLLSRRSASDSADLPWPEIAAEIEDYRSSLAKITADHAS